MTLDIDEVTAELRRWSTPEVVEPHLHQRADGCVTGDVAAEVTLAAIRAYYGCHRVPAHERAQPLLDRWVAGRFLLEMRRNRVDVCRVGRKRDVRAGAARLLDQLFEQVMGALGTLPGQH